MIEVGLRRPAAAGRGGGREDVQRAGPIMVLSQRLLGLALLLLGPVGVAEAQGISP